MVIAVLGATGFVGLELVKKLITNGHKIKVLSRKNSFPLEGVNFFKGDLLCKDYDFTKFLQNVDILYNCSGCLNDSNIMYDLHVTAIKNLLNLSQGNVKKWVQLGSVGSYGTSSGLHINEASSENPSNEYEKTKTLSDNLVKISNIPHVILRPSNIFGMTMSNQSLFQLMQIIKSGYYFHIGSINSMVNYVHIDDVVNALINCGANDFASNKLYVLSQCTRTSNMIDSLKQGMSINKQSFRLSERFVRIVSRFISLFYKSFPLTKTRIDALTSQKVYRSDKILNELDFKFMKSLNDRFYDFARETHNSQNKK